MILKQKVSPIFEDNINASTRLIVNRGGTRSTKTYSLLQMWIEKSFMNVRKNYAIMRRTTPSLRLSALRDFEEIIFLQGLEGYFRHHKTHSYFENTQTKSKIYFVATDNADKVHGVKWDAIQLNEGDQIPHDVFKQLILRTEAQIYIDFNPSDPDSWINTHIEQERNDYTLIKSSYLDNPFLSETLINEIELLRSKDPVYWNIYGLGEYGFLKAKIYPNCQPIQEKEYKMLLGAERFAGLDIGDVNPSAMIEFKYINGKLYGRELYYESFKDPEHLIKHLEKIGFSKDTPIYTDTNFPLYRRKLLAAGFNAKKAKKDSVIDSIKFVRNFDIFVTVDSVNYWKEQKKYKYMEKDNGEVLERPVKFDDHLMDAKRYAIYSHLKGRILKRVLK